MFCSSSVSREFICCSDAIESAQSHRHSQFCFTKGHCATSNQLWLEWKQIKKNNNTLIHQIKPFSRLSHAVVRGACVCIWIDARILELLNKSAHTAHRRAKQRKSFQILYDTNWLFVSLCLSLCTCIILFSSFIYYSLSLSIPIWDVFECIWICGFNLNTRIYKMISESVWSVCAAHNAQQCVEFYKLYLNKNSVVVVAVFFLHGDVFTYSDYDSLFEINAAIYKVCITNIAPNGMENIDGKFDWIWHCAFLQRMRIFAMKIVDWLCNFLRNRTIPGIFLNDLPNVPVIFLARADFNVWELDWFDCRLNFVTISINMIWIITAMNSWITVSKVFNGLQNRN